MLLSYKTNIMSYKVHPNFPTSHEAADYPQSVYSDHSPLLIDIQLFPHTRPVKLISLKMMDASLGKNLSGFHFYFEETAEETERRYKRTAESLLLSIKNYEVDILHLQEVSEIMFHLLFYSLKNWKIIFDAQNGLLSAYNCRTFAQLEKVSKKATHRLISIKLKHRHLNTIIETHNIWCYPEYFPTTVQKSLNSILLYTPADFSIVTGVFNAKMAALGARKRNIITSIKPLIISHKIGLDFTQITDFSDGAFLYNKKEKKIHQLEIQTLSFYTGKIIEEDELNVFLAEDDAYYPTLSLDNSFKKPTFQNSTLTMINCQRRLQSLFNDESIQIFPIANAHNESGIGVYLQEGSDMYSILHHKLSNNSNFQFRRLESKKEAQGAYECIFILNNQQDVFYKAIEEIKQDLLLEKLKIQIMSRLHRQITLLSIDSWMFRSKTTKKKLATLIDLNNRISEAWYNSLYDRSVKDILNPIIREWEFDTNNQEVLVNHRLKLLSKGNNTLTKSEKLLREIKNIINFDEEKIPDNNFREDIIHRLIHLINQLTKKNSNLATDKRLCFQNLLHHIQHMELNSPAWMYYQIITAWEKTPYKETTLTYNDVIKKKEFFSFAFFSASENVLFKLKSDLYNQAKNNGEDLTVRKVLGFQH